MDLPACSYALSLPVCTGDLDTLKQSQRALFLATVKCPSFIYGHLAQYSRDGFADMNDSQLSEEYEIGLLDELKFSVWWGLLRWALPSNELPLEVIVQPENRRNDLLRYGSGKAAASVAALSGVSRTHAAGSDCTRLERQLPDGFCTR